MSLDEDTLRPGGLGRTMSSVCFVVAVSTCAAWLLWSLTSGGLFWDGRLGFAPVNLLGNITLWVSGANSIFSFVVLRLFDRRRGWFGLVTSCLVFLMIVTAETATV